MDGELIVGIGIIGFIAFILWHVVELAQPIDFGDED